MLAHAKFSPSSAHRYIPCPGSVKLEAQIKDISSDFADEGTAAHHVGAWILKDNIDDQAAYDIVGHMSVQVGAKDWPVTNEMIEHALAYAHLVREYADGEPIFVEQRLEFSKAVDYPGQFGTSDTVIVKGDTLVVVDLKYGMGVRVDAFERLAIGADAFEDVPNPQMALYALGAVEEFNFVGDIEHVLMVIHQPRLDHVSEFMISVKDLYAFAETVKAAIQLALSDDPPLNPGEKQCRFCKAKATCPALKQEVLDSLTAASADDFDDLNDETIHIPKNMDQLGAAMSKIGLIEDWCKAIRAATERALFEGDNVPGYKIVQGRQGNRKWSDEEAAEKVLKAYRYKVDEMYDKTLISPTKAEKLMKSFPAKWKKVQDLITRSEGQPSVAPVTDPRPAISPQATAEDFV